MSSNITLKFQLKFSSSSGSLGFEYCNSSSLSLSDKNLSHIPILFFFGASMFAFAEVLKFVGFVICSNMNSSFSISRVCFNSFSFLTLSLHSFEGPSKKTFYKLLLKNN